MKIWASILLPDRRSLASQPRDDLLGIPLRRKDWIEHMPYHTVIDDECHALQQHQARCDKRRQLQGSRKLQAGIAQNREWQVQAPDHLTLVRAVLCAESIDLCHVERTQFGEMVAEGAALRRYIPGRPECYPTPPGGSPGCEVRG